MNPNLNPDARYSIEDLIPDVFFEVEVPVIMLILKEHGNIIRSKAQSIFDNKSMRPSDRLSLMKTWFKKDWKHQLSSEVCHWKNDKNCFYVASVMLLVFKKKNPELCVSTREEFLHMYPFVAEQGIDEEEIDKLHAFRDLLVLSSNLWKIEKNYSLKLLPPIVEGRGAHYPPGSSPFSPSPSASSSSPSSSPSSYMQYATHRWWSNPKD